MGNSFLIVAKILKMSAAKLWVCQSLILYFQRHEAEDRD